LIFSQTHLLALTLKCNHDPIASSVCASPTLDEEIPPDDVLRGRQREFPSVVLSRWFCGLKYTCFQLQKAPMTFLKVVTVDIWDSELLAHRPATRIEEFRGFPQSLQTNA
jgi:hypothetical protein